MSEQTGKVFAHGESTCAFSDRCVNEPCKRAVERNCAWGQRFDKSFGVGRGGGCSCWLVDAIIAAVRGGCGGHSCGAVYERLVEAGRGCGGNCSVSSSNGECNSQCVCSQRGGAASRFVGSGVGRACSVAGRHESGAVAGDDAREHVAGVEPCGQRGFAASRTCGSGTESCVSHSVSECTSDRSGSEVRSGSTTTASCDSDGSASGSGGVSHSVGGCANLSSAGARVSEADASSSVDGVDVGRGKHFKRNKARRDRAKLARAGPSTFVPEWRRGAASTVCTVDTRTAVEIEAAQSLARRRIAENELAVVQANRKVRSLSDEKKTLAIERLQGARLSQRINQANVAAQKAYAARDKSLTSVDSAGSAGEYAMRQEIKAARNSQSVNEYLRKQIDIFAKHADSSVIAAADRVPKPTLDDMYDVMKDQYDLTDPEQCAQLDADVAVENAKWNDVLYSGEGFMDEPVSVKKPESGETLEELYAKVRAEDKQFDIAQREIDAANKE